MEISEARSIFTRNDGKMNSNITEDLLIKRGQHEAYDIMLHETKAFANDFGISDRVYAFVNGYSDYPLCENGCGKKVTYKSTCRFARFCSNRCAQLSPTTKSKIAKTSIDRYGVDNIFKSEKFKESLKENNMQLYGVENIAQAPHIRDKIKQAYKTNYGDNAEKRKERMDKIKTTCLERYGANSPVESEEIKRKIKDTLMSNYGVEYAFQHQELYSKFKRTMNERYGVDNFNKKYTDHIEELRDPLILEEMGKTMSKTLIANKLGVSISSVCSRFKQYDIPYDKKFSSILETYVMDSLGERYKGVITPRDCSVIPPYELDLYVPEFNVAIECNGTFWHSENGGGKDKWYHTTKTMLARRNGVRLIHVFEHDWYNKNEIIKSILLNAVGVCDERVYARKCEIYYPNVKEQREFLDSNHLQGYNTRGKMCIGLMCDGVPVSMMSVCKPRFSKDHDYEILRFTNKLNTVVVGGFSKILKHLPMLIGTNKKVISYCDASLYNGNSYEGAGFTFVRFTDPSYVYFKGNYRYMAGDRTKFQKHKLNRILPVFDEKLTEWENMQANGYDRVWDCGNSVWEMTT